MLLNEFYTIIKLESSENYTIIAQIELNENHEIFSGHFPGNPIVPGVCLVQIIKEVLSRFLEKQLMLVEGKNIKFTAVVEPSKNKILDVELKLKYEEEQIIYIQGVIYTEDTVFLKIQARYKCQE